LASVVTGQTVNLCLPLNEPSPPLYKRPPYEHVIFATGRNGNDDYVNSFYLQGSTQWDGLRHIRCREFGFYRGVTSEFEPGGPDLGIEHWAKTGVIGRGVLVDLERYCAAVGREYDPFSGEAVTGELVTRAAEHQGIDFLPGDILCLHFGWMEAYFGLPAERRAESPGRSTFAGLEGSEDFARFLWNGHFAAVVCDNPAIEVSPGDPKVGSLHRRLIPMVGMAFGELFDFRELSSLCEQRQRWDFMFVAIPLNIPGGVGSPGNAIALI
jgi:kynurenine formamidase